MRAGNLHGWKSGRMNQGKEGKKGRNGSIMPPSILPFRRIELVEVFQQQRM